MADLFYVLFALQLVGMSNCVGCSPKAGCDHVVCLDCIRTWRKSEDINNGRLGCPVCRAESTIVVPSAVFATGKEKNEIRAAYMTRLSTIPCKNFNFGQGRCSFAPECMYAHMRPDGSLAYDENGLQSAGKPAPIRSRRTRGGRRGPNQTPTQLSEREIEALQMLALDAGDGLSVDTMVYLSLCMRLGLAPEAELLRLQLEASDDEDNSDVDYFQSDSDSDSYDSDSY